MTKQDVIYISGPMTGCPDYNYPAFYAAEDQLRRLGYNKIINPAGLSEPGTDWRICMRRAITELMKADVVVLLPGWERSKGAQIESLLAVKLNMRLLYYEMLLPRSDLP